MWLWLLCLQQDPWHAGGVLENVSSTIIAIVIPNGAHHQVIMATRPSAGCAHGCCTAHSAPLRPPRSPGSAAQQPAKSNACLLLTPALPSLPRGCAEQDLNGGHAPSDTPDMLEAREKERTVIAQWLKDLGY